jgi:hypothetical protein
MYISIDKIFDLNTSDNELAKLFNPLLLEKISAFRELWKKTAPSRPTIKINYTYASQGVSTNVTPTFVTKKTQIIEKTKQLINNSEVRFELIGAKELLELFTSSLPSNLSLEMKGNPASVSYRDAKKIGYIGFVSLSNFFKFISNEGKLRDYIFEDNVRDYQGDVDVNADISKTLSSDLDRDFWWFNNGITIVADDATVTGNSIHLDAPQIVNGLQTSHAIYTYLKEESRNDDRCIMVRVVVSQDKATVDKVISATNRQTPVTSSILRATDEIQRKIELYFSQKGYYYDRRKNYYKNQGKSAKKIFSIQTLAQNYFAICLAQPSQARATPTSLTKDEKRYKQTFRDNIPFGAYLNCCLIRQRVDDFFRGTSMQPDDKIRLTNFKLHVARLIPSLLLNEKQVSAQSIAEINMENVTPELIEKSFQKLDEVLGQYTKDHNENIINIAKSQTFSEYITNYI